MNSQGSDLITLEKDYEQLNFVEKKIKK